MIGILSTETVNPWENLAVEAALFESLEADSVCLYLWQNHHTVVIGKNQNPWKECRIEALQRDGGRLARRSSGGGAVYHDRGNLNYTFVASNARYDLTRQLGVVIDACRSMGIDAVFSGRNDILAEGRKFSGNAFQQGKNVSLQHGTLLIDTDFSMLEHYLSPSTEKLRAKGIASMRSRVCNLRDFAPGLTTEAMREAMMNAFARTYGGAERLTRADLPTERVAELTERFASWEWNFGETLRFDVTLENRFSWGEIELNMQLQGGRVSAVKAYSDAMNEHLCETLESMLMGALYGPSLADALPKEAGVIPNEIAAWLRTVVE